MEDGVLGKVLWVRSRETNPGPHSDWFYDVERAGGGAMINMGCHCVEIIRNFLGKQNHPVEVMCWSDTLVHPVTAEDHAIGLNHWLAGFEMFAATGQGGYVAEKAEPNTGRLFPVGDETGELGYTDMFTDMFAVMDACYASARSKRWELIHIEGWQAAATEKIRDSIPRHMIDGQELIKEEVMPDGKTKRLLHNPQTGRVTQQVV